jgi:hypothetical protein
VENICCREEQSNREQRKGNEGRGRSGEIKKTNRKGRRKMYLTESKESGNEVGNKEDEG